MGNQRYWVLALGLCCVFVSPLGRGWGQAVPARSDASGKIELDVAVTTGKGAPAGMLSESDFTVLDNKVSRPIVSFTRVQGKEAPVQVILVLDAVNTPYTYLQYQRDQVNKYLRSNGGVLPFATTFAVLTDKGFQLFGAGTKDGNALAAKLEDTKTGLRTVTRSQGFWGADERMTLSLNALRRLTEAEEGQPGRKLVLWVSPGWPLLSGPGVQLDGKQARNLYENVIAYSGDLRQAGITLYSVNSWGAEEDVQREFYYQNFLNGLKGPNEAEWGDLSLQVLSAQSGGLVLNSNDLLGMMKQCVADADVYYRIVVEAGPDEKPNVYHAIEVKVAQSGLVARTRAGYYGAP
jgi:VWFA-related protein